MRPPTARPCRENSPLEGSPRDGVVIAPGGIVEPAQATGTLLHLLGLRVMDLGEERGRIGPDPETFEG